MKTNVVQSNFLSGVLDPRAAGRVDTDAYNNGLLEGLNLEPIHLGGMRRRAGLRYRVTLPNILTRIDGASITATAPNGGTANNAKDDDPATILTCTTDVGTTDPFVVVHYNLGAQETVLFADVIELVSTGGSSTEFAIQYSADDSNWTTLGSSLDAVSSVARSYRRAGPVTARYWRVVKVGGTDMGAVDMALADFNLWQDSGGVSEVRCIPFEVSTEDRYVAVLTDRSATIVQAPNGNLVTRVPMPYESADLADIDAANDVETMVLVHEDFPPRFLLRESSTNFQTEEIDFENIPKVDYADASSPSPTTDQQTITFSSGWVQGDTFQIELEGARTASITYAGDVAQTALNIAREVQKLYTVPGFTGVTCTRTGALTFRVDLADASAKAYELMSVAPLSSQGTAAVVHTTTGVSRHENAWSATRGYPRTTTFFQGRLYFGGTRSLLQSLFGSVVNNILDFEILEGLDDESILTSLAGQRLNAIQGLYAGRSLQMFTSGGEFRYAKPQGVPVTPADAPASQTEYGAAKIRPVSNDGATLFVQRNRKSVRDFRFDYEEDAFNSLSVSSLAPHLITEVADIAAWNGSVLDEISLVFVVNGDGTIAVLNSRREANVQAWTQWTTFDGSVDDSGGFKAVAVVGEDVFFAVRRTVDGTAYLFLEQRDSTLFTDCAVQRTATATDTITGLDHLNGEEVRVKADGYVFESVTPSAGSATIQDEAEDVEIGLNFNTLLKPMPLNTFMPVGGSGPSFLSKRRIVKVWAKVKDTLGLLINDKVIEDRRFDVNNFDEAPTPVTGNVSLADTTNWDEEEDKIVTFSQVDPLPMEILAIKVKMEGEP